MSKEEKKHRTVLDPAKGDPRVFERAKEAARALRSKRSGFLVVPEVYRHAPVLWKGERVGG